MLKTKNNVRVASSVVAVARAYARMPEFSYPRAVEIAKQVDTLLADKRQLEATFALCVALLKAIGVHELEESLLTNPH